MARGGRLAARGLKKNSAATGSAGSLLNNRHKRAHDVVLVEFVVAIAAQMKFDDVLGGTVVIADFEKAAIQH
jgi:hypothetical protein